mmetsp:Transcript_49773/g.122222  ORF Transcript_49773/g.122222 Transcript_49773/m.122222 type:complete len:216 (+) Transcript_49773:1595-2242(+)
MRPAAGPRCCDSACATLKKSAASTIALRCGSVNALLASNANSVATFTMAVLMNSGMRGGTRLAPVTRARANLYARRPRCTPSGAATSGTSSIKSPAVVLPPVAVNSCLNVLPVYFAFTFLRNDTTLTTWPAAAARITVTRRLTSERTSRWRPSARATPTRSRAHRAAALTSAVRCLMKSSTASAFSTSTSFTVPSASSAGSATSSGTSLSPALRQ